MKLPDEYWTIFLDSFKTSLEQARKLCHPEYVFRLAPHIYDLSLEHKDELKELVDRPTRIYKEWTNEHYDL